MFERPIYNLTIFFGTYTPDLPPNVNAIEKMITYCARYRCFARRFLGRLWRYYENTAMRGRRSQNICTLQFIVRGICCSHAS